MRFRPRRAREGPEVNLILLIDVLLVILVFPMIVTTYPRCTELEVNLPTAEAEEATEHPGQIAVSVAANGVYSADKQVLDARDITSLADALRNVAGKAGSPEPIIIVNADAQAVHQAVANVMEAARVAGLPHLTFATQTGNAHQETASQLPSRMPVAQHRLTNFVTRQWQQCGWFAWVIRPLSWLFGAVSAPCRLLFRLSVLRSVRLPMPVVVIDNVAVDGTGKTPAVIALASTLAKAGLCPGIVLRGYGAQLKHPRPVREHSRVENMGDKPLLIARATDLPVWVFPNRVLCARTLLASHPGCNAIVCDDGLQHYRLRRDIEIIVFDTRMGSNDFLLPAGPLRKLMTHHRDATLINDLNYRATPDHPDVLGMRLELQDAYNLADPGLRHPLAQFARIEGGQLLAVADIDNPKRFFASLRAAGLKPSTPPLPDHYDFADSPFTDSHAKIILITEKDAVKCGHLDDPRIWVVSTTPVIDPVLVGQVCQRVRVLADRATLKASAQ